MNLNGYYETKFMFIKFKWLLSKQELDRIRIIKTSPNLLIKIKTTNKGTNFSLCAIPVITVRVYWRNGTKLTLAFYNGIIHNVLSNYETVEFCVLIL